MKTFAALCLGIAIGICTSVSLRYVWDLEAKVSGYEQTLKILLAPVPKKPGVPMPQSQDRIKSVTI